jgi:hypothetical protein
VGGLALQQRGRRGERGRDKEGGGGGEEEEEGRRGRRRITREMKGMGGMGGWKGIPDPKLCAVTSFTLSLEIDTSSVDPLFSVGTTFTTDASSIVDT